MLLASGSWVDSPSELRDALAAKCEEIWYAYVPFEGGAAVFDANTDDAAVSELLEDWRNKLTSHGLPPD